MTNYIVIGYYVYVHRNVLGPFEVYNEQGRKSVKEVQDKVAAELAGDRMDEVIYTVVPEDDFRQYYRDILQRFFKSA